MRPLTLLAVTSACVAVTLTGCSTSGSAAAKDVTITACAPSPGSGHPTATGQILNHSSKSSLYAIHVTFTDSAGNGVGDGIAAVAKVDPRTTAIWHANGTVNAKGPVKCKVSSVTRSVSP